MSVDVLLGLFLFVLGLNIGSFLNVVIARVPEGRSIVRPGSHCPRCGYALRWYDNVPLFSWMILRARCRACALPISARYPLVELLTGVLFLACYGRFGFNLALWHAVVFIGFLIPLIFIDAEHWILPFELTLPGIATGIFLALPLGVDGLLDAVFGAVAGFLLFRAMEYFGWLIFRKEALGGGDKYLLALIGAFLGWGALLGVIFLASLQGAIFGAVKLVLTGRAGPAPQKGFSPAANPHVETADGVQSDSREDGPRPPPALEQNSPEPTMTWDFLSPGLPVWRRLVLIPISLLFQSIPDEPPHDPDDATADEEDWVPGATNLPFGPWLALAGIELILFGPLLVALWPGARLLFFSMKGLHWA